MDRDGFAVFLKKSGRKDHVIAALLRQAEEFGRFLGKPLDSASAEDLDAYAAHQEDVEAGLARKVVRGLILYYTFSGMPDLAARAARIRERGISGQCKSFPLKDFIGVDLLALEKLQVLGIASAQDMLEAGSTRAKRLQLVENSGLQYDLVLELVKLSDLARVRGVKGVRARLYYEAGLDTLAKIAACEPEEVGRVVAEYVRRGGFPGIPPLPKETASLVMEARSLPAVVEY